MDTLSLDSVNTHYLANEESAVSHLLDLVSTADNHTPAITEEAMRLVEAVRAQPDRLSPLERFLIEYDLATEEGVLLMCLAETLLRVPDKDTVDALIADKVREADWEKHLGNRDLLVNASTWGLMLTGQLLNDPGPVKGSPLALWRELVSNLSEPVVRNSIRLAMRVIGDQFVLGESIDAALARADKKGRPWEDFSFDMLGEAALTSAEARGYLDAYANAIAAIAAANNDRQECGVSVKLSALCPRFEVSQWQRAEPELTGALLELARQARDAGIPLTVDAEESERLALGLQVFSNVFNDDSLRDWNGLGLAVQAYQKRALPVLDHLAGLAVSANKKIPVRLVKGAYWDGEIKQAQVQGLTDFPVFTRKCNTDLSYQAAVIFLAEHRDTLYPQFATHNAFTTAWVKAFFTPDQCEFQRLWGMGETLYDVLNTDSDNPYRCRVYAPVGSHDRLLPYLVRRLLENGANTSFVHRIADATVPVTAIVADPVSQARQNTGRHRHPHIALPLALFSGTRRNSAGINLADRQQIHSLLEAIHAFSTEFYKVYPLVPGTRASGEKVDIFNPFDARIAIGECRYTDKETVAAAIGQAAGAWRSWQDLPIETRTQLLEKTASLLETNRAELIALCVREAGKTIPDAHNEIREAVDFLRYYASECRRLMAEPVPLPGPVGESNTLELRGKGVFACISPWNFPVAIFTGQVAAALAAGNTVLAKPAEETSACAMRIVQLFHEAGIPEAALTFIPGDGKTIGDWMLQDDRIAGVAFTGSTAVARAIEHKLAQKPEAIATLVAETGGINVMLVDSSALAEQVVKDVVFSAFNSAGQRCSALRVLYLQEEIADQITNLVIGRLQELQPGDPGLMETDIGPVISAGAMTDIQNHVDKARQERRLVYQGEQIAGNGYFVPPAIINIDRLSDLKQEVFGPVLHIVRYQAANLMSLCDEINQSGFALTFGIHSRISHRIEAVCERIHAGNVYINRNMVGAVVGSQPFGGSRLSGTGPKAGGPYYLPRFCTEQTITNNTAAIGGDASLFAIDE